MNISQDQLKAFYEVAKLGGFTVAADSLGLTQSALSHRIKNLETELEVTLFIRASDGVRLTEAGQKLLKYAQVQSQIEDEFLKDFKSTKSGELAGTIRIAGASTVIWSAVAPALGPLLRSHPQVHFEFMVRELSDLSKMLSSGEADMIVTCGNPPVGQFEEIEIGHELNVLVESEKYKSNPDIYLDHDFKDQTTIQYLKDCGRDSSDLTRRYMDDINGIITGVQLGLGRAVLPLHLLNKYSDIKAVRGAKKMKTPVFLCFVRQPFYTRLHNQTIDLLKSETQKFFVLE